MKRFVAAAFVLLMGGALISCGPKMGGMVEGETYTGGKWVNDNTFRIAGMGVPKKGLTNVIQRKGTAQEAAIIDAQRKMIEKFKGARLEGASGMSDMQSTGIAVAKEFGGMIRGGSVVTATFDKDQNCEVIYELSNKGLKKQVMGGVQ